MWWPTSPENWPTLEDLQAIAPPKLSSSTLKSAGTFTFDWFDYRENWEVKLKDHDFTAQLEFEAKLKSLRREETRRREREAARRKLEQQKLALKAQQEHERLEREEAAKRAELERKAAEQAAILSARAKQAQDSWNKIYAAKQARRKVANDYPYEWKREQQIIEQYHAYRDHQAAPPGYMWQLVQATGWRLVACPVRPYPKRKFHVSGQTQLVNSLEESRKLGLWWFDTPTRARAALRRLQKGYFDRVGTNWTRRERS